MLRVCRETVWTMVATLGVMTTSVCAQTYSDPYAPQPSGSAQPGSAQGYPLPGRPATSPPVTYPAAGMQQPPQYQPQYQQQYPQQPVQTQYQPANPQAGYPLPNQGPIPGQGAYQASAAPAMPGAPATGVPVTRPPSVNMFQPSQIVARVGNHYILAGDVDAIVNQMIGPAIAKAKTDQEREAIESSREQASKHVLSSLINTKVLYVDFERNIEKQAGRDKLEEIRRNIDRRMRDAFEKDLAAMREKVKKAKAVEMQQLLARDQTMPVVAMLMEEHQIENMGDLDLLLRQYGSSLEKTTRYYREQTLGRSQVADNVRDIPEVTHQKMLDYYLEHQDEFSLEAKARFEMMSVKLVAYPSREAAYQAIGQMGNEVFYGATFESVARKHSQDPSATRGGYFDWTKKGSLATEVLDQAVFSLEPGKLSQILEDGRGFYIVRVIEREEAGSVSFEVAQKKIKELIETQYREDNYRKYLEQVKARTSIWTIYDQTAQGQDVPAATQR